MVYKNVQVKKLEKFKRNSYSNKRCCRLEVQ